MREIKFRGKTPEGKTVYGWYVPFDYANFGVMVGRVFNDFQTYIEHHRGHGIMDEQGKIHAVIQESVQQFCGVDQTAMKYMKAMKSLMIMEMNISPNVYRE